MRDREERSDREPTPAPPARAASLHRVYRDALQNVPPHYDALPVEVRRGWQFLAEHAPAKLRALEGRTVVEGAQAFLELFLHGAGLEGEDFTYGSLTAAEAVAWQAVTRHAAALMDYDPEEYGSVESLEASWGRWARERMAMLADRPAEGE